MTDTIDPKTISRIQKLLALSKDGGATEAEAALAAEMAQRLMAEHNLSMATVEAAGGDAGEDAQREKVQTKSRAPYKWRHYLMQAVGKLNFVHVTVRYERRGSMFGSKTHVFDGYQLIGRRANVAATQVLFDYLVHSIDRLAKAEVEGTSHNLFSRYAASFREGCSDQLVDRLQAKLREILHEQERKAREDNARARHPSAAPGTALVVVLKDYAQQEEDLNEDMRQGLKPGTTAARRAESKARNDKVIADRAAKEAQIARDYPDESEWTRRYLVSGFSLERARELAADLAKPAKPETEAQKRKRQEREERYEQRQRDRYNREWANKDMRGYCRGQDAGDTIGLDPQVGRTSSGRLK